MKTIRWGFVGCGDVTERKSGPAFSEIPGSCVEAVMSRSEDRARSYAERHHIKKWYTDAIELVEDPDVDAVYVATPPSSHALYAIMAMRAGKPVYVEKPLASSYEDCVRINRVSTQTGVPCFVAYYRRYLPYFMKVKSIIDSGRLGKIMNVQVRFSCHRNQKYGKGDKLPWRLQPEIAGGGYFYDLAPHQLDLLQYLFGVIIEAFGICENRLGAYEVEDNVSACFKFESGIPGSGSWSFTGHESSEEDSIEVIGEKGSMSFSVFHYNPIRVTDVEGTQHLSVPNPPYVQLPIIRSVVEDIQGISICSCTSISATPTNWVLDRILGKF